MMKTKGFFVTLLLVVFLLSFSFDCGAESIKAKIFFKDLKRSEIFIDKQYAALVNFISLLTEEDVKIINSRKPSVEIFNADAAEAFKHLDGMDWYKPRKVKGCDDPGGYFPKNFLAGFSEMFNYDKMLGTYNIPPEDREEVLSKYSDYLVWLLGKLKELRAKVLESGLKIDRFPKLNDIYIGQKNILLFLMTDENSNLGFNCFHWRRTSSKMKPQLYSNEKVLTAAKLWMEFYLANDLTSDNHGSYEEEVMTEIEKIEKRLVMLSGSHSGSGRDREMQLNKQ